MNRRNFLQAMLAAAAAPAICHAENLMKIYVPAQKIFTYSGSPGVFGSWGAENDMEDYIYLGQWPSVLVSPRSQKFL